MSLDLAKVPGGQSYSLTSHPILPGKNTELCDWKVIRMEKMEKVTGKVCSSKKSPQTM